jgi:hypothetical protein
VVLGLEVLIKLTPMLLPKRPGDPVGKASRAYAGRHYARHEDDLISFHVHGKGTSPDVWNRPEIQRSENTTSTAKLYSGEKM